MNITCRAKHLFVVEEMEGMLKDALFRIVIFCTFLLTALPPTVGEAR